MVYNVSCFYSRSSFYFEIVYLLPLLLADTYQTLERNGMNCSAGCRVWQAAPIPADSSSPPTVIHPVLFIIFANYPFVSPTRLSVQPCAIQNPATQINAVAIWMMSKSSRVGTSVFKLNEIAAY